MLHNSDVSLCLLLLLSIHISCVKEDIEDTIVLLSSSMRGVGFVIEILRLREVINWRWRVTQGVLLIWRMALILVLLRFD